MKNVIYLALSLDGYIARKDGDIDWLMDIPNPENSDYGFGDFIESIDAIVMGKNTFQKVLTFGQWPYTKPVFVLSNTLDKIPLEIEGKARLVKGEARKIIEYLHKRKYYSLYIDGGKTVQQFLKEELIDEIIISKIPILLGSGIPLFGELDREQKFEHVKTESYNNGILKSHYRKVK